jgi:hypothetical protein
MGSAIRITIKSPEVDAKRAEEIAKGAERIHRCEITGEILGGGNRYVDVTYSDECQEILARRWQEQLRDALARIPEGDRTRIEPIEGAEDAGVCRERQYDAQIWIDGRAAIHFNPDNEAGLRSGAFHLATLIQVGDRNAHIRAEIESLREENERLRAAQ